MDEGPPAPSRASALLSVMGVVSLLSLAAGSLVLVSKRPQVLQSTCMQQIYANHVLHVAIYTHS